MSNLLIPSFLMCNVSESLRSLTKYERCEQIAHSLIFSQKTSDLLGKPMSEFPALAFTI